jgi:threonine/homoserine/homoserine lactone efflux protein
VRLSEFLLASLIVELTPGPNMAYLASLTVTRGRRAGALTVAGVAAGLASYGVLSALGLTLLIAERPAVYELLRWAGVGYLLWLAWESWRGRSEARPELQGEEGPLLLRGFITNLLNPKAALFYLAVLPNFIDAAAGSALAQNLVLVAAYVAVATAMHGLIVLLAAQAQPYLVAGARERTLRQAMAVALVVIAAWIVWQTRR